MKTNPTQKRVNPIPMLTTLTKIFNLDLKILVLTNRSLTTLAIAVAKLPLSMKLPHDYQ